MTDKSQSRELQYRKKPVVIEAMQFIPINLSGDINKNLNHAVKLDDWLAAHQGEKKCRYVGNTLVIPTLEGNMTATAGDWIIRGVKGELYPCKPDIFAATYEPADQPAAAGAAGDDELADYIAKTVREDIAGGDHSASVSMQGYDWQRVIDALRGKRPAAPSPQVSAKGEEAVPGTIEDVRDALTRSMGNIAYDLTGHQHIRRVMSQAVDEMRRLRVALRAAAPSPAVGGEEK